MNNDIFEHVHLTISGPDTPGITAELTKVIAESQTQLLDIEQVVVQGQLTLCLLLALDASETNANPILRDLLFTAKRMGMELEFRVLKAQSQNHSYKRRFAVTAIGDGLDASGIHAIAEELARYQANIEHIRRLNSGALTSLEVIVSFTPSSEPVSLREDLLKATAHLDIDIAVQRERLTRRSKRLVVLDMDSTLIRIEIIDELARSHGVVDKVAAITHRAMSGELDFTQSLRERVQLLKGMKWSDVEAVAADLPITEGAPEMLRVLHTLGYKTGVISGGFLFAANRLKERLGIEYAYANQLEVQGDQLTGRVLDPIITPQRKADLLETIAQGEGIHLEQTIAIGDGANDLAMLDKAGLGIAFHAKPKLKEAADTALSAGGLDRILYLLGHHQREIQELLGSKSSM
ncbi:MAG: phosphoserine phosphatase SerB [Myxococcota bacterium]